MHPLIIAAMITPLSAVHVVEHRMLQESSPPPPPGGDLWSEPWSVAAILFVAVLLLLVFARCVFSVCEISCDREDEQGVATQSSVQTTLSRA